MIRRNFLKAVGFLPVVGISFLWGFIPVPKKKLGLKPKYLIAVDPLCPPSTVYFQQVDGKKTLIVPNLESIPKGCEHWMTQSGFFYG